ncbi:hypothetical protein JQ543_04425 [Bradyrhizobium diazoefficiens]|nr:hypothetical protein [Bradyrhizobium diazoefficiens]MBR0846984.1 hypothetical protein [Bradyrhizobium diazoefficiens]
MSRQGEGDKSSWSSTISAKDLLVVVPVLASIVALSYEAGRFIPIGIDLFGIFPLTDHLAFAGGAIPLALLAALMVVGATAFPASYAALRPDIAVRCAAVIVFMLFLAPLLYDEYRTTLPKGSYLAPSCMMGGVLLVSILLAADLSSPRNRILAASLIMAGTISIASAIGAQSSYNALLPTVPMEEVTTPSGKHVLRVLLGNATALIGVDDFGRVVVIKGDQVKLRTWVSSRLIVQAPVGSAPKQ